MQQFADEPTATPTHAYVHYITAIGSPMTYMHAQYSKISIWVECKDKMLPLMWAIPDTLLLHAAVCRWTYSYSYAIICALY
jgi:hypothetical protein